MYTNMDIGEYTNVCVCVAMFERLRKRTRTFFKYIDETNDR